MLKRLATLLIAFPAAILMVALSVGNRQPVQFALDPISTRPLIGPLEMPLFVFLIAALMAGVFVGGAAVWFTQGRFRRAARMGTAEAKRWQTEAGRLTRERDANTASAMPAATSPAHRALTGPGRRDAA